MEAEFLELMGQTIQRKPAQGLTAYGQRTHKPPVEHQCHLKQGLVEVSQPDGETREAEGTIWLAGVFPDVTTADRVILPDGKETGVVQVQTVYDEDGPHHTVIMYGDEGR